MISINKGLVLAFFEHNMKMVVAALMLFAFTLAINVMPALTILVVSILASGLGLAGLIVVAFRALKQADDFNVYDFFRIPRPEERDTPKTGPALHEVKANESHQ